MGYPAQTDAWVIRKQVGGDPAKSLWLVHQLVILLANCHFTLSVRAFIHHRRAQFLILPTISSEVCVPHAEWCASGAWRFLVECYRKLSAGVYAVICILKFNKLTMP